MHGTSDAKPPFVKLPIVAALLLVTGSASAQTIGYDPEGGAFIRTADRAYELNPYGMMQLTHQSTFGDNRTTGFNLHSAKLIFHGHALAPEITFHYQANFGEGRAVAEDMYVRWDPTRWFGVLVGQNEVPYNRQHITLEAYQQFVERSLVDARFNLQRDIGGIAYVATPDHHLELTLGVFNGARQNAPNDDTSYMTTARLAVNPWGPIQFREADLADSHHPKLSFAVAFAHNPQRIVAGTTPTTLHAIDQGVMEATLRFRGLSLTSEAHARSQRVNDKAATRDFGAFAQVGYFVVPQRIELVARHAAIGGATARTDVVREDTIGINDYLHGHRFKLQLDGSRLRTGAGSNDYRIRAQIEFFL